MNAADFTDEELMAYADGELAETRAAALDRALASDEGLAERLAVFLETRLIAAQALRPMLDEPVPRHLEQRVRDLAATPVTTGSDETVVAFTPRTSRVSVWQLPLAASIALAVGLGAGLMLGGTKGPGAGVGLLTFQGPELDAGLATLASGESRTLSDGTRLEAITTFRDADNNLCREFEADQSNGTTYVSIACHDGQDWQVRIAIAAVGADETGYAPASSMDAIEAYLAATNAGSPLLSSYEAEALAELP